jgi:hypothetical protein
MTRLSHCRKRSRIGATEVLLAGGRLGDQTTRASALGPAQPRLRPTGTSSLYAALDLTTGKVIGALHSCHQLTEFLAFPRKIGTEVPADLDMRVVLDNASTHKTSTVKRWPNAHPRSVLHFTPTNSSWLGPVERWFAEPTSY